MNEIWHELILIWENSDPLLECPSILEWKPILDTSPTQLWILWRELSTSSTAMSGHVPGLRLTLLMNFRTRAVTLISLLMLLNLSGWIASEIHRGAWTVTFNTLEISVEFPFLNFLLASSWTVFPLIGLFGSFGHSSSSLTRYGAPFHHRSLDAIFELLAPREAMSLGLSSVGQCI